MANEFEQKFLDETSKALNCYFLFEVDFAMRAQVEACGQKEEELQAEARVSRRS